MVSDSDTLGAELAAARNGRDLTLDQVERQTRIRAHYLDALENNDYALLPSAVQGRGFLRNYARFLGLDVDDCERRFNAALYMSARRGRTPTVFSEDPTLQTVSRRPTTNRQTGAATSQPRTGPTSQTDSRPASARPSRNVATASAAMAPNSADPRANARRNRTRNMTLGTLGIIAISLIVLTLIVLYTNHALGVATPASAIMSPLPNTDTPTSTVTPTITPTPDHPTPLPKPATTGAPVTVGGIALQVTAKERAPLRITVDDQVVYSGVPAANTILKYQAKNSIQVHTGDAGAIDILINGVLQPPIGEVHAIADKTYTLATINSTIVATTISSPTTLTSAASEKPVDPTATVFIVSKP